MATHLPDLPGLEIVDLRARRDEGLLRQFYEELYLPAFPVLSEQENPAVWRPRLWGEEPRDSQYELYALLAGTDLDRPARRKLYGGIFFELYRGSMCALLTYLVVGSAWRRRGLAGYLVQRAYAGLQERARTLGTPLRAVARAAEEVAAQPSDC